VFKLLESIWKVVTLQNGIIIRGLPLYPVEVESVFEQNNMLRTQNKHTSI